MPSIRIVRWHGAHEVSQSRKVAKALSWVAVPVRQGRGYCRLVQRHGAKGLGVWIALLELCAAQDRDARGTLVACWEDAASMARLPYEEVAEVLPTLIELGWIESDDESASKPATNSPATSTLPEHSQRSGSEVVATGRDGTEQDRTERKRGSAEGERLDPPEQRNGHDPVKYPHGPPMANDTDLTPAGLFYLWNAIAEKWGKPKARVFSPARKRHAKTAISEEADGAVWREAFTAICADPFLGGQNDRGTIYATFDYAMRPEKRAKWLDEARGILEATGDDYVS